MNKDNAKDYLPLVKALAEGKEIQISGDTARGVWVKIEELAFSAPAEDYRIKPEPKEIWVNIYPEGNSGRNFNSKRDAEHKAGAGARQVRFREVIE